MRTQLPSKVKCTKTFRTEEGMFSVYDVEKDARGRADMFTVFMDGKGWIVRNVLLPAEMRGKGVATRFYQHMNELSIRHDGNPLRSSRMVKVREEELIQLSNEGVCLWNSFVRKGLAIKNGHKDYEFKPNQ